MVKNPGKKRRFFYFPFVIYIYTQNTIFDAVKSRISGAFRIVSFWYLSIYAKMHQLFQSLFSTHFFFFLPFVVDRSALFVASLILCVHPHPALAIGLAILENYCVRKWRFEMEPKTKQKNCEKERKEKKEWVSRSGPNEKKERKKEKKQECNSSIRIYRWIFFWCPLYALIKW